METHLRLARSDDRDKLCELLEQGLAPYGLQADYEHTDYDILDVEAHYGNKGGVFCILESDD